MCGSVTAAIPRKQPCRCGDKGAASAKSPQIIPRAASQAASDIPSPTKTTFKIQKSSRPASGGRKQSFDPSNFERMNMNSVNIVPFKQIQNTPVPVSSPESYMMASPVQPYAYTAQYANIQSQYSHISMQPPPISYDANGPIMGANGFSNGILHKEPYAVESPLATPTYGGRNGSLNGGMNGGSCCVTQTEVVHSVDITLPTNAGSCCAPKKKSHSQTSSITSSISEEPKVASCCSSKPVVLKEEPTNGSVPPSPRNQPQMLPQASVPFSPVLYQNYLPQEPTVFTYPATYGSFQNPLQPSAWRQGIRSNYTNPQDSMSVPPDVLPFNAPIVSEDMNTVHTCTCGDTCQCIGCAAHPYNDATQDYVRSAWATMTAEQSTGNIYSNVQPPPTLNGSANGNMNGNLNGDLNGHTNDHTNGSIPQNSDLVSSPTPHTPSSNASANGEEQSLSASDFFFVSYPFSSDGCGGDTMSCPCGDDCECLGCTIHRQPDMTYT
ncbi:hypothetical protein G7Y89_g4327 [Cudoniella acicularis]|uniref:Uncharacterized protein n=1 Tax=Cudoniella acicularis TaxID=354080 RepID=A0A8H4W4T4_9HELO|nr:hypothetical protein G7Y89_g4327 [Cudoniella acicularis]